MPRLTVVMILHVLGSALAVEVWPNHSDYVECYVTATVNPTHLWVQVLSPRSAKLEEINRQLSRLYSDQSEVCL